MNTDKIYAEQIANEYAPKKTSKVVALKKLDQKAKKDRSNIYIYFWHYFCFNFRNRYVFLFRNNW